MIRERGLKGNCPYKRKKGGVCEVSIPNARRGEGARLGRGQQSRKRGVKRGFSPPMTTHPKPHPSYLPYPARELCTEKHRKIVELAGGREVEGDWRGGEERVAQPCPTSPRGQSHGKGPPIPLFHTGPPTLGERDMAFPRVSSPLPLGVETKKRGEGQGVLCVVVGQISKSVLPNIHTLLNPNPSP